MTFMMTTIVGIILGIFGSKILLMIVLRLLGINVSVSIIFNYHAILETIINSCVICTYSLSKLCIFA